MSVFTIIYWAGMAAEVVIRIPFGKNRRKRKVNERRVEAREVFVHSLLFLGLLIMPLLYSTTKWLDFADYRLPAWVSWSGAVLLAGAVAVFWRAHLDLGANWSPTLEVREGHEMVTRGIYGTVRHPMYTSQWIWALAQALLLPNWLAGFLNLPLTAFFGVLRIPAEEKMMMEAFGAPYGECVKRTGRFLPRLRK